MHQLSEAVNQHINNLRSELQKVKENEVPMCRISFGTGLCNVIVNMEDGFVNGKTPIDRDYTLKTGKPRGMDFMLMKKIAASEVETGVWDGTNILPVEKMVLGPQIEVCTGVAIYRSPGSIHSDIYFRLGAGSRWSRQSEFWIKNSRGKKPQEVRDAIQVGNFHQLPNLVGCSCLMELKVEQIIGEKGHMYPSPSLTREQVKLLNSWGTPDKFPQTPLVYFTKELFWAKRVKQGQPTVKVA